MTAPDLRSDETKYWHAEIARAVAGKDAEIERLRAIAFEADDKRCHLQTERDALRAALQTIADGHEAPHWLAAKTLNDEQAAPGIHSPDNVPATAAWDAEMRGKDKQS